MDSNMEASTVGNQTLQFCEACGDLRVKEVKTQIQRIFTTKSVPDDVCCICLLILVPLNRVSLTTIRRRAIKVEANTSHVQDESRNNADTSGLVDNESKFVDIEISEKRYNTRQKTRRSKVKRVKLDSVATVHDEDNLHTRENDAKGDGESEHGDDTSDAEDPTYRPHEDKNADDVDDANDDDDAPEDDVHEDDDDSLPSDAECSTAQKECDIPPLTYTIKKRKGVHPKLVEMMNPSSVNPKRPFSCKFCTDEFAQLLKFQRHIQTHTGEKPMPNPFYCTVCGADFSQRDFYDEHEIKHTGIKPFKCKHRGCKKAFSNRSTFNNHRRIHTNHKPFKCKYCKKAFRSRTQVLIHERYHTGERRFKCKECDKAFFLKVNLIDHMTIHTGEKPFQCNLCPYRCRLEKMLVAHQKTHLLKHYRCERCLHVFTHKFRFDTHQRLNKCKPPKPAPKVKVEGSEETKVNIDITHMTECLDQEIVDFMDTPINEHKPFRCKTCKNRAFSSIGSFIKHVSSHMPEGYQVAKKYKCAECGARFKSMPVLEEHKFVHTVVRPFICPNSGCNSDFKSKTHLNLHIYNIHTKNKTYICEICAKAFVNSTKLRMHQMIHNDEKPIQCGQCDKAFKFPYQLRRHENRIHNHNDVGVVCEQCGKHFKNKDNLRSHAFIHTGLKPFACHLCSYQCNRNENLKKHMRVHSESTLPKHKDGRIRKTIHSVKQVQGDATSTSSVYKTVTAVSLIVPLPDDVQMHAPQESERTETVIPHVHAHGGNEPVTSASVIQLGQYGVNVQAQNENEAVSTAVKYVLQDM